jgi:hypothetical protein
VLLLLVLLVRDVEDSGDGECGPQSTESAAGVERAMRPPLRWCCSDTSN